MNGWKLTRSNWWGNKTAVKKETGWGACFWFEKNHGKSRQPSMVIINDSQNEWNLPIMVGRKAVLPCMILEPQRSTPYRRRRFLIGDAGSFFSAVKGRAIGLHAI